MEIISLRDKVESRFKGLLIFSFTTIISISIFVFTSCTKKNVEEEPNVFYICSMDPQVMEKRPGKCPICKMALTKTEISPEQDRESIKLSETQMKLGNIKTQKVGSGSVSEGINFRGRIVQDERKVNLISSRVPGRIDKLYFKNQGEKINMGDRVYDIYSEDLQSAIKQYLLIKEKAGQLNGTGFNYAEMLNSSKDKLLVFGLGEKQINKLSLKSLDDHVAFYSKVSGIVNEILINEGDYVNEGASILKVADYSALWVEGEVYPENAEIIKPGLKIKVRVEAYPNEEMEGVISFENPELEEQSKINLVRIDISNKEGKYKPGMRVTVTADLKGSKSIVIPEEAVLYQPEMNTVWVMNDKGSFAPRMVETGNTNKGLVQIKSGLKEGDVVVISGAYLIDSEYRLRKGSGDMPGMDHGNNTTESAVPHQH